MDDQNPKFVIILSGKRKCGKDFVGHLLQQKIGPRLIAFRIAEPIKSRFAKNHNLNLEQLMSSSDYKEKYRQEMVKWSEEVRKSDSDYFLKIAIQESQSNKYPIWMLTDARRLTDVHYFKNNIKFQNSKIISLRITASDQTRKRRGWEFTDGIDNAETECGLDQYNQWDFVVNNDATENDLMIQLQPIIDQINTIAN